MSRNTIRKIQTVHNISAQTSIVASILRYIAPQPEPTYEEILPCRLRDRFYDEQFDIGYNE